ncbi:MAG: DUF4215 domain-containing protein, partial [Patescibacteria group bacterium]
MPATTSWTWQLSNPGEKKVCRLNTDTTCTSDANCNATPGDSCVTLRAMQGFIDGTVYALDNSTSGIRLQTHRIPAPGCSAQCLNAGSRNDVGQCGNGITEFGEDCEKTGGAWPVQGCDHITCKNTGVLADLCGNGTLNPGESCDKVGGVFPPGCKDPSVPAPGHAELNNKGCLWLGSSASVPVCGNSRVERGEDCEALRFVNGSPVFPPGCSSSNCVNTGTTSTTATPAGTCGDGNLTTGEACDKVNGAFPAGCKDPAANPAGLGCYWLGSAAGISVCGDGNKTAGEGCDDGNTAAGDGCSATCLNEGTKSACSRIASPQPGVNCVLVSNSVCGDGVITDGEGCDDGNAASGDGCSSICLNEGTPRSCRDAAVNEKCVNYCGNMRLEEGEACEADSITGGVPHFPASCDSHTCLHLGTDKCPANDATPTNCCGNGGALESGEECEAGADQKLPGYCSNRCLLKGSSFKYDPKPSFCGDGIAGPGEAAQCDGPSVFQTDATAVDPFQVVLAGRVSSNTESETTAIVTATLPSIPAASQGSAKVHLSCTCKTPPSGQTPEQFCRAFAPELGCNKDGCCEAAPTIIAVSPPNDFTDPTRVCRNSAVTVVFDQSMDKASVQQKIQIGEQCSGAVANGQMKVCRLNPMIDCAAGDAVCTGAGNACETRTVLAFADTGAAPEGFWRRAYRSVTSFIRNLLFTDVSAGVNDPPAGAKYCVVAGQFSVNGPEVTFAPKNAWNPTRWHRIFIAGEAEGVRSVDGIPLAADRNEYFKTRSTICRISRIKIDLYGSQLLMTRTDQRQLNAQALESGGTQVVSTPAYAFAWGWDLLPAPTPVIAFDKGDAGAPNTCGSVTTNAGDCNNHGSCVWNSTVNKCQTSNYIAVRVRGSMPALDGAATPKDGEATAKATATVTADTTLGDPDNCVAKTEAAACSNLSTCVWKADAIAPETRCQVSKPSFSGTRDLTVMICNNPWPAPRQCLTDPTQSAWWRYGSYTTPWDTQSVACYPRNSTVWSPFYDRETNSKFYYCRDVQRSGDAASDLPALNENPVVIRPGGGILKEFLFSFPGRSDALGLRIEQNSSHLAIGDWFKSKGFSGSTTQLKVGSYDAIRAGGTVYVNAVNIPWTCSNDPNKKCVDARYGYDSCGGVGYCRPGTAAGVSAYPNVYSFSYAGSAPETPTIFDRLIGTVDLNIGFNDNKVCLTNSGWPYYDAAIKTVACVSDQECQKAA